jgi:hypothetical protein
VSTQHSGEQGQAEKRYARSVCGVEHFGLPADHPLYECCDACNYDRHRCHFCGDDTSHDEGGVHPECVPRGALSGR